jgi:hypothetical protein
MKAHNVRCPFSDLGRLYHCHLRICTFDYLRICTFDYLRICTFEYLSICTFDYLRPYLLIWLSSHLCIWLSSHLYIRLSAHLSIWPAEHLCIWPAAHMCIVTEVNRSLNTDPLLALEVRPKHERKGRVTACTESGKLREYFHCSITLCMISYFVFTLCINSMARLKPIIKSWFFWVPQFIYPCCFTVVLGKFTFSILFYSIPFYSILFYSILFNVWSWP